MRVIAGSAKGRRLRPVPGERTRPITDRTKAALFDRLGGDVVGSRFLDLFGGTGSVAIEALSRGAEKAVLLEINRQALRTIEENLRQTGLSGGAQVLRGDAFAFIQRTDLDPFDIIFVAPPQHRRLWIRALQTIDANPSLLAEDGQVVVQIHPKELEPLHLQHLELEEQRKYGSTLLLYLVRRAQVSAST